ncbi:MAG: hypothetical protein RL264_1025 [Bacteroidota bacterium]|jgi:predicted transcriptional regulator
MKDLIAPLNKAFESRIRLGIMSLLMIHDTLEFSVMKELLEVTDGNLASHVAALEKLDYLLVNKQFVGKKPNTTYFATIEGKRAFNEHLSALEQLIKKSM